MSGHVFTISAGNPNMVMALAGNKSDLEEKRNVTAEVSNLCFYLDDFVFSNSGVLISFSLLWYYMLPQFCMLCFCEDVFYNFD